MIDQAVRICILGKPEGMAVRRVPEWPALGVATQATAIDPCSGIRTKASKIEAAGVDHSDLATKADLATAIADLKADMLKVAIGVAMSIVIANATLTAVFVFGALRLLQP